MQSTAQALPYLEAAVKLDRQARWTRAPRSGQAYLEAGNPERAIPQLEAALAEDDDGSRALPARARLPGRRKDGAGRGHSARVSRDPGTQKRRRTKPSRASLRPEPALRSGSRTSSTRLVRTFRSTCFVPLGQTISTSTCAALPVPKCTGAWLEEA